MAGPTEVSRCELVADGLRRTILLCAPRDNLRMRPPLEIAIASAIALADMTGGDVGALEGGSAGSGRAMEAGRDEDKIDMPDMASGDVRDGMFMGNWELVETRLTFDELLLAVSDGVIECGTDVTAC